MYFCHNHVTSSSNNDLHDIYDNERRSNTSHNTSQNGPMVPSGSQYQNPKNQEHKRVFLVQCFYPILYFTL
jgi:hypothetical protein